MSTYTTQVTRLVGSLRDQYERNIVARAFAQQQSVIDCVSIINAHR